MPPISKITSPKVIQIGAHVSRVENPARDLWKGLGLVLGVLLVVIGTAVNVLAGAFWDPDEACDSRRAGSVIAKSSLPANLFCEDGSTLVEPAVTGLIITSLSLGVAFLALSISLRIRRFSLVSSCWLSAGVLAVCLLLLLT